MSYSEVINFLDSILVEYGTTEDGEPNKIKNEPFNEPEKEAGALGDDLGDEGEYDFDDMDDEYSDYPDEYGEEGVYDDEDEDQEDEDEEDEDDEIIEMAKQMVDAILLEQDNKYQEYFRSVMHKHGFDTLKGMRDEEKKAFFKDVKRGWSKVGEGLQGPGGKFGFEGEDGYKGLMGEDDNSSEEKGSIKESMMNAYKKYFYKMAENIGIDINKLNEKERVEFYSLVNEAFVAFHLIDINELV